MRSSGLTGEGARCGACHRARTRGNGAERASRWRSGRGVRCSPFTACSATWMGSVRALYEHARAWVAAYNREHEHDGKNPFESNGLSHLRLARTERNLFHFLYLSPHMEAIGFGEVYASVSLPEVQRCIEELGHLSPEDAHELYLNMIVYVHGMAAMLATGASFTDDELLARMDTAFRGFVALVRP